MTREEGPNRAEDKMLQRAEAIAHGFRMGESAYKRHKGIHACPFKTGCAHRKGWRRGWKWAMQQEHGLIWSHTKPPRPARHTRLILGDHPVTTLIDRLKRVYRS